MGLLKPRIPLIPSKTAPPALSWARENAIIYLFLQASGSVSPVLNPSLALRIRPLSLLLGLISAISYQGSNALTRGTFVPQKGHWPMCADIFGCHKWSGRRRMLLTSSKCRRQPLTTKDDMAEMAPGLRLRNPVPVKPHLCFLSTPDFLTGFWA